MKNLSALIERFLPASWVATRNLAKYGIRYSSIAENIICDGISSWVREKSEFQIEFSGSSLRCRIRNFGESEWSNFVREQTVLAESESLRAAIVEFCAWVEAVSLRD